MNRIKLDIKLPDGTIKRYCVDCPRTFLIKPTEVEFFNSQGWPLPKRCKPCRMVRRESRTKTLKNDQL